MYNKNRQPTNPTGCGNYQCPIRSGCGRADVEKFYHVSVFHPSRIHGNLITCAMRLEKVAS
jgi:hypothetical protein